MIRSGFMNQYLSRNQHRQKKLNDEGEQVISLVRPMSSEAIRELPSGKRWNFVDKVLGSKKIAKLLFSTSADKEIDFFKKTKDTFRLENGFETKKFNSNKKYYLGLHKSKNGKDLIEGIKRDTIVYQLDLKKRRENLKLPSKTQLEKDIEETSNPLNEMRKKDFTRVLNKCMDYMPRSQSCSSFTTKEDKDTGRINAPNIKLNLENVFSRLYHNRVYDKTNEKNRINQRVLDFKTKKSNSVRNLSIQEQIEIENERKRLLKTNLKIKNVINSTFGKEYIIKITPEMYVKCFKNHSGGPKSSKNFSRNEIRLKSQLFDEGKNHSLQLVKLTSMVDNQGDNVLHSAILNELPNLVDYFLDKGVDPNYQNKNGDTPLHYAMRINNSKIIGLLLKYGGDITIKNKAGEMPYDLASYPVSIQYQLETILLKKNRLKMIKQEN